MMKKDYCIDNKCKEIGYFYGASKKSGGGGMDDPTIVYCRPCDKNCFKCSGDGPNDCILVGLDDSSGNQKNALGHRMCGVGSYYNNGVCALCLDICNTCTALDRLCNGGDCKIQGPYDDYGFKLIDGKC